MSLKVREPLALAAGFSSLLLPPTVYILRIRLVYRVLLSALAVPFFCLLSLVNSEPGIVKFDSVEFEGYRFHVFDIVRLGDYSGTMELVRCDSNDLACEAIPYFDGSHTGTLERAEMIVDEARNELHVLRKSYGHDELDLLFTYAAQPRMYIDSIAIKGQVYYLAYFDHHYTYPIYSSISWIRHDDYEASDTPVVYLLYVCQEMNRVCERLPFRYVQGTREHGLIEMDEVSGDLVVTVGGALIYTLGEEPECHSDYCELEDS